MSEEKINQFKQIFLENPNNIIATFTLEERIWFKEKILETMLGQTTLFEDIAAMGEIKSFKPLFTSKESEKMLVNINYDDNYQLYQFLPYLICLNDNQKKIYIKEILEKQIVDVSLWIAPLLIESLSTDEKKLESIEDNILYLNKMKINIDPSTLVELVNLIENDDKKMELLEEFLKTDEKKLEFYIDNIMGLKNLKWSDEFRARVIRQIPIEKLSLDLKIYIIKNYCIYLSDTQIEKIISDMPIEKRLQICKQIATDDNVKRKALANIIESISIENLSYIKKLEILIDCMELSLDVTFMDRLLKSFSINPDMVEEIKRNKRITEDQMMEIVKEIPIETLKMEEKFNIFSMVSYKYENIGKFDKQFIEQLLKSLPIKESSVEEILRKFKLLYFIDIPSIISELIASELLPTEAKYQILVFSSNYDILTTKHKIEIIKSLPIKEKLEIINIVSLDDEDRKEILKTIKKEEIEMNFKDFALVLTNLDELIEILTNMNLFTDNLFLEKIKDDFFDYVSQNCFIEKNRLNQFYQMFGIELLRFINNKNIREILKLPDDHYNKIIELYDSSTLNNTIVNTVYNSLIQREFGRTNKDVIGVNANLKTYLDKKDLNNVKELVKIISENLNIDALLKTDIFIKYISKKNYTPEYCYKNIESILMEICMEQMQLYNDLNLDLLKVITNNYITIKREKYLSERQKSFNVDLNFPTIPHKDKLIQKVIRDLLQEELINLITSIDLTLLSEEQKELIINKDLLIECIKFKKNPVGYQENKMIIDKKLLTSKYLKIFNQITEIMFNNKMLDKYATSSELIQYIPKQFGIKGLEVLAGIDFNKLSRNVLFTDKFDELKKVMEKYGFLGWGDIFEKVIDSSRIEVDVDIIASLIEYFSIISEKVDKNKKSGMMDEYLKKASLYSPFSKLCKVLFEEENLRLLKDNPGTNSARTIVGKDRIIKAEEYIPLMYQRESITVPSINESFANNKGDKILNVVIGDTTNMINFTYGERTDACMRIGGVAHSLFEFSLINENGFHIRFEDPKTGQFVSRATCFRNGNTLFINQLRNSCLDEYTDEDLCEICTKLANKLIELSSNSKYPINNVITSNGHAMNASKQDCVKLNITAMDIKKGYNGYTDISPDSVIVLATSAKDKLYEDFDLGSEKVERYPVLRTSLRIHDNKIDAASRINHLMLINQTLIGDSIGAINPLTEDNIKIAITGEDWFVYVNDKGEIESQILDNLPESKRQKASEEVKTALDMISQSLSEVQTAQMQDERVDMEIGGTHARR